jgi:DNA-3-methyladenine glycosylase
VKSPTSKGAPAPNSNSAPPPERLRRADLPSETLALAHFLIGKLLVRRFDDGTTLIARIVETEAYGIGDPASHAFRGPTKRNRAMFEQHAHAYVYLIYGTSYCVNVSTEGAGIGAAVLIRAAEPLAGLDRMREARGRPGLRDYELARGPGNLCRAFGIGPADDGIDLDTDERLMLCGDGASPEVGTSERIGLTRAVERPHRFYARGSRAVSGRRSLSP